MGTVCQIVLLTLIGALIALVVPVQVAITVGLIVLSVCPGGPSSNLITHLAKGDVALSVTLTTVSSIITVFTIALLTNLVLHSISTSSHPFYVGLKVSEDLS